MTNSAFPLKTFDICHLLPLILTCNYAYHNNRLDSLTMDRRKEVQPFLCTDKVDSDCHDKSILQEHLVCTLPSNLHVLSLLSFLRAGRYNYAINLIQKIN